jgi:ABC-type sugar transport system ATPase subunit
MLSKGESKSFENNNNGNNILQIKNLSKAYHRNADNSNSSTTGVEGEYTVLSNIDIDIKDGEFVTIVGPSGCSKSTLNLIAGIDKEYSSDSEILFNNGHSNSISDNAKNARINQDKILIF